MRNETSLLEKSLYLITQTLLAESNITYGYQKILLTSSLSHDLGIDSLMRLELFQRIEKQFSLTLPDKIIGYAETLQDIKNAILTHAGCALFPEPKKPVEQIESGFSNVNVDSSNYRTLQDILVNHAEHIPDKTHICYVDETGSEEKITYQQLFEKSLTVAHILKKLGIKKGETVAIMLPSHPTFFYVFMGVLLAGCIPVPIYPLAQASQLESYIAKEAKILKNAQAAALITFNQAKKISYLLRSLVPCLRVVKTAEALLRSTHQSTFFHRGNTNDYALIQYTSGSTADPKGILLTHKSLLANIRAYGKALHVGPSDIMVSWLPLYHDLGLIGAWLGSFYHATPLIVMSPLTFITRPEKWLWAIHNYRGTISAGPNFAYELCTKKIDDKILEGLDLSSWRIAINGAELVLPETLEAFNDRFNVYGFKPESLFPVYGLAESSLGVTTPPAGRKPKIDTIERTAFEINKCAVAAVGINNKLTLQFVSCGLPMDQHAIRIVNDEGEILSERFVGNLQFAGPSSMLGYYNNPQATQAAYHHGWWDTGDLGYIAQGELYITGRKKDLIIKAGRNFCANEIESEVASTPGIRKGCVIAFSTHNTETATEKLVVVAETNYKVVSEQFKQIQAIRSAISRLLNTIPDDIVLLPPKTIPKTSSGKLQRSTCKTAYLNQTLQRKKLPFALQLGKLFLQKIKYNIISIIKNTAKFIYSFYAGLLITLTLIPVWLLLKILPPSLAVNLIKYWIKVLFLFLCCPIKIAGIENLPKTGPAILAVNHASYIDSLALTAALPNHISFIGKSSLFKAPVIRTFLKKLGHLSIDKSDILNSIKDLEHICCHLNSNNVILAFPEGTFTSTAGLRLFKLGIFKIAAEMNIPIYPISLSGTRRILQRDRLMLQPNEVNITIGKAILPIGKNWNDIHTLKDDVRNAIAKHCGEISLVYYP